MAAKKSILSSSPSIRSSSYFCDHESCFRLRSKSSLAEEAPSSNLSVTSSAPSMTSRLRAQSSSRDSSLKRLPSTSGSSSALKALRPSYNTSESVENKQTDQKESCDDDDYINDQLIEDPLDDNVNREDSLFVDTEHDTSIHEKTRVTRITQSRGKTISSERNIDNE